MKSLPNQLEKTLDLVLDEALKAGAEAAEVLYQQGEQFSVKAESGNLGEYKVAGSEVFGVRLFKQNKVAVSYSEDRSVESLKAMINSALSTLPFLEERPHEKLVCKEACFYDSPETQMNSAMSEEEIKERIQFALALEQDVLKADHRVQNVPYSGVSEGHGLKAMKNTLGGISLERQSTGSCYTSALMKQGDTQAMFYSSHLEKDFRQLDPKRCREESLEKAALLLEGKPLASRDYSVVFSPDLLASLVGIFSGIFSAKSLIEGTNPFKGKLGEAIAIPEFSLIDDPKAPEGLYPTAFDDEGFPTRPTVLVDRGVYQGLLHNSATASELKMAHTPNASRSARSSLGVGSTHKRILRGSAKDSEFFQQGEIFEIFDMQGLHSGANPTSGNFSFAAAGRFWRDGRPVQAVRHVTVSGNFYQAIKNISAIGDVFYTNDSKSFTAPKIRFEGLHTAGA